MATTTPVYPLTLLEAINQLLAECGLFPVSGILPGSLTQDASSAKRALDLAALKVLQDGYEFNTTDDFEVSVDVNGECMLPANTMQFTPNRRYLSYGMELVTRGNRLYNKRGGSFNIGQAISGRLVEALEFEELPQAARWYITARAGYLFCAPRRPTQANSRFTETEMFDAKAALERYDGETTDKDLADTSPHFALHRRR